MRSKAEPGNEKTAERLRTTALLCNCFTLFLLFYGFALLSAFDCKQPVSVGNVNRVVGSDWSRV